MVDMGELQRRAQEARSFRISQGLSVYKTPFEKSAENPSSLRCAINAMCYDCIGQDSDPNWRESVKECPCTNCPLYNVRQYK